MLNSLMYKLCYWDFGGIRTHHQYGTGFDRVRNVEIGGWCVRRLHLVP
jgi:dolichyl-diphosphooligosaccharide--protein glycosyltransferase